MSKSFLATVLRLKAERLVGALAPEPAPPAHRQPPRRQPQGRRPAASPQAEGRAPSCDDAAPRSAIVTEPATTSPTGRMMVSDVLGRGSRAHAADVEVTGASGPRRLGHLAVCGETLVVLVSRHWSGRLSGGPDAPTWTLSRPGMADAAVDNPLRAAFADGAVVREACGEVRSVTTLVVLTGGATPPPGMGGIVPITSLAGALSALGTGDAVEGRKAALDAWLRLTRGATLTAAGTTGAGPGGTPAA